MAVVTFNRAKLERLVGKKISDTVMLEKVPLVGTPVEALSKKEVSVEVFPNRPDLLSIEGFARCLEGFLGVKAGYPELKLGKSSLSLRADFVKIRPYITGAVVRKVKLDSEDLVNLMQFQEKIHDTLGRKRRKVAVGLHDLDPVKGSLLYRNAKAERFQPLDMAKEMALSEVVAKHPKGKDYGHLVAPGNYPVIVDGAGIISFPPIINSERTRVTEETRNMFIDVTGTDKLAISQVLQILCAAFADRGGQVQSISLNGKPCPEMESRKMKVNLAYTNKMLGLSLNRNQLSALLRQMRFGVSQSLEAIIPPYRTDILHPIDLIEDIGIAYGYMNFKPAISETATTGRQLPGQALENRIREALIGFGFMETFSFTLSNTAEQFSKMRRNPCPIVSIANPRTPDYTHFRLSCIPSLLNTIRLNSRHELPQKIFEIGGTAEAEPVPRTHRTLAAAIVSDKANYTDVRGYLESVFHELGVEKFSVEPIPNSSFIRGRVSRLKGGDRSAVVGEIHPQVLKNFGVEYPVAVFEVNL